MSCSNFTLCLDYQYKLSPPSVVDKALRGGACDRWPPRCWFLCCMSRHCWCPACLNLHDWAKCHLSLQFTHAYMRFVQGLSIFVSFQEAGCRSGKKAIITVENFKKNHAVHETRNLFYYFMSHFLTY